MLIGNLTIAFGIMVMAGTASSVIMPYIEGRFWPVVVETAITSVEPKGVGSTIRGSSRKVRDCVYQRMQWKLEGPFNGIGVNSYEREAVKQRGGGIFEFGPWDVQAGPHDFSRYIKGYVWHQCPNRPWETRTLFWEAYP